jgi:hypothetical protein
VPPTIGYPLAGLAYPEVTQVICRVPSTSFSQAPWYTLPAHLCRFGVRSIWWSYFLEASCPPVQSNKHRRTPHFVTTTRYRNINLFPIDYAFRPRLRSRLTLRGLALRRNPWAFGENVSHVLFRYSCQNSLFRYLQLTSRLTFAGLRNAPLPNKYFYLSPKLRCMALAPLHLRRKTS